MTTRQRNILTTSRDYDTGLLPCSSRGVSGDGPEGGARRGVPRLRLVTAASGGSETARRALRPGLRGARCTCCGGNAGAGSADPKPKIATVERREARLPSLREAGTLARCLACSVIAGRGCPLAPERLSALRPPLGRGGQGQGSGAIASRERDGLFDIVSRRSPHPPSPEGGLQRTSRVAT